MIAEQEASVVIDMLEKSGADPEMSIDETFLGDVTLYLECLEKLREDTSINLLGEALASGNMEAAIRAVHTLKGVADNLALFPLVDAAVAVLRSLRAGQLEGMEALIEKLKEEYGVVIRIISAS